MNQAYSLPFHVSDLQGLRSRLQGSAFVPGDDDYEQACLTWETVTFKQHPAIVVMPASATDVLTAVLFAREHHLPIGVQGGGHGHPYPMEAMEREGALLVSRSRRFPMTQSMHPHCTFISSIRRCEISPPMRSLCS